MIFKEHIETKSSMNLYATIYTDIIVRPTNKKHESGYKMMNVIGISKNGKKLWISKCCDVLAFKTNPSRNYSTVQMDIPKKNEIHYFLPHGSFTLDSGAFCSTVWLTPRMNLKER